MPPMKRVARPAWVRHREKVLYIVVGGWNTLFQYGAFALCWYLLHGRLHPALILLIAYGIASINGFIGFRHIVFGPAGRPFVEYARFQAVYLPLLALNMVALPVLLKHTSLNAYAIQALFAIFSVVVAFVGNKYFTFRRAKPPRSETDDARE
jgi:putative flippase GtrA